MAGRRFRTKISQRIEKRAEHASGGFTTRVGGSMGAVLTILIVLTTGRMRRTQGARGPRGYATFASPPPRLIKVDPTQKDTNG